MDPIEATKLTVYIGDSSRRRHRSLCREIVKMLQREEIAGATVLHGIEGYGGSKVLHTASVLDLSADLPLVIVAIDRPQKIETVLPKLEGMIDKGLVTTERVRVLLSRPTSL